jgi:hypothetical protein
VTDVTHGAAARWLTTSALHLVLFVCASWISAADAAKGITIAGKARSRCVHVC